MWSASLCWINLRFVDEYTNRPLRLIGGLTTQRHPGESDVCAQPEPCPSRKSKTAAGSPDSAQRTTLYSGVPCSAAATIVLPLAHSLIKPIRWPVPTAVNEMTGTPTPMCVLGIAMWVQQRTLPPQFHSPIQTPNDAQSKKDADQVGSESTTSG